MITWQKPAVSATSVELGFPRHPLEKSPRTFPIPTQDSSLPVSTTMQ